MAEKTVAQKARVTRGTTSAVVPLPPRAMTAIRTVLGVALLAAGGCASHRHPARDVLSAPEGVYHLEGQVDALNFQLAADGTFHATACGCDFYGETVGRWRRDGTEIVFTPQAAAPTIWWVGLNRVPQVTGQLTAHEIIVREGTVLQRWLPGRVCSVCGGTLGPTGQRSCPEPLPKECGG
jgi:hypothetical protein